MEYTVAFTDNTLCEAGGLFTETEKIMSRQAAENGIGADDWTLRSTIVIEHDTGTCSMVCEFNSSPEVRICSYSPSLDDIYNDDIRCFKHWCMEFGWKSPNPTSDVIADWPRFWKVQWETHIIDSEIFDAKYGKRPEIDDSIEQDNDEEEEI